MDEGSRTGREFGFFGINPEGTAGSEPLVLAGSRIGATKAVMGAALEVAFFLFFSRFECIPPFEAAFIPTGLRANCFEDAE